MKRTKVTIAVVASLLLLSVTLTFVSLGTLSPNDEALPQSSPTQTPTPTPTTLPTQTPHPSPSVTSTHLTPQTYTPIPTPPDTPTPTPTPTSTSLWAERNWTIVDGAWNVTNNSLYGSGSAEAMIIADNTTQTNYSVTMNTIITGGVSRNESSIVVRYVDANNFYWMGVGCWGHEFSISRMLNGVPTEIASYGLESNVQRDVTYTITAEVTGNTLTLYVNQTQALQISDISLGSGAFGIRTFDSSIQTLDILQN